MTDINATLIPLTAPIASIMSTLKVLVGGVFGIYVIMLIVNVRQYFMLRNTLKLIRRELDSLSAKVDALGAKRSGRRSKGK